MNSVYKSEQNVMWFATDKGLYHLAHGEFLVERIPDDGSPRSLYCISEIHDELWVGGEDGLYNTGETYASRVDSKSGIDGAVLFIVAGTGGKNMWVGANSGLYIKYGETYRQILPGPVTFLENVEGIGLVVSNDENTFHFDRKRSRFVKHFKDLPHSIANVNRVITRRAGEEMQPYYWVGRRTELYGPDGGLVANNVIGVESVGGELWYSADGELFFLDGQQAVPLFPQIQNVELVREVGGFVWIATAYNLLRAKGGVPAVNMNFEVVARRGPNRDRTFEDMVYWENYGMFIWGDGNIYRLYDDVAIDIHLRLDRYLLFNMISVASVNYTIPREGNMDRVDKKYRLESGSSFESIIDTNLSRLHERAEGKYGSGYRPLEEERKILMSTTDEVFVTVRDAYGRDFYYTEKIDLDLGDAKYISWLINITVSSFIPFFLLAIASCRFVPLFFRYLFFNSYKFLCLAPLPYPPRSWLFYSASLWPVVRYIYALNMKRAWSLNHAPLDDSSDSLSGYIGGDDSVLQIGSTFSMESVALKILETKEIMPVVCKFSRVSSGGLDIFQESAVLALKEGLPNVGRDFCENVLSNGRFVFLFELGALDDGGQESMGNFAGNPKGRRTVIFSCSS